MTLSVQSLFNACETLASISYYSTTYFLLIRAYISPFCFARTRMVMFSLFFLFSMGQDAEPGDGLGMRYLLYRDYGTQPGEAIQAGAVVWQLGFIPPASLDCWHTLEFG